MRENKTLRAVFTSVLVAAFIVGGLSMWFSQSSAHSAPKHRPPDHQATPVVPTETPTVKPTKTPEPPVHRHGFAYLYPTYTSVGDTVNYAVYGFQANTTVDVTLAGGVDLGSAQTNFFGQAYGSFTVPSSATGGWNEVDFTSDRTEAAAWFAITPTFSVDPSRIGRGDSVTVSLSGYAPNESVSIEWSRGFWYTNLTTVTTDANGDATATVTIPYPGRAWLRADARGEPSLFASVLVQGGRDHNGPPPTKTPKPKPTKTPHPHHTPTPEPTSTTTPSPTPTAPPQATPMS